MNGRLHAALRERASESIAPPVPNANRVERAARLRSRRDRGHAEGLEPGERLRVGPSVGAASREPLGQVRELLSKHGALQRVHAVVAADGRVLVFADRAVHAGAPAALCELGVVRHDHARVTERAERLRGLEAETAERAERAHVSPVQARAERLCRVLHDRHPVRRGERDELVHARGLAVEVHDEHGARARAERRTNTIDVERERLGVDVDEHRAGSDAHDALDGGEERERRRDHLVARSDAERQERAHERVRAARDPDGVARAQKLRRCGLERLHFGAEQEPLRRDDALDRGGEALGQARVLGSEIEQRNVKERARIHGESLPRGSRTGQPRASVSVAENDPPSPSVRVAAPSVRSLLATRAELPEAAFTPFPRGVTCSGRRIMGLGSVRRTVLVTGAAGFLGSHLVDRLLAEGFEVVGLDSLMTGDLTNLSRAARDPHFHFQSGDVREPIHVYAELVFNLACPASPVHYQRDPYATFTTSVLGAQRLIEMARGRSCTIIHASTSEVYGDPTVHPQPESYWGNVNPIGPRACYDEGKRGAETLLVDARRSWGIDARIVRIFNTYGPRMAFNDGRVVSNFIVQGLKNEPLTVFGDGSQSRSFCYVDDLIEGFIRVARLPGLDGPLNLGNPGEFTMVELARLAQELTGSSAPIEFRPLPADDPRQRRPDIRRARELIQFEPAIPLREGLSRTVADFRERLNELGAL